MANIPHSGDHIEIGGFLQLDGFSFSFSSVFSSSSFFWNVAPHVPCLASPEGGSVFKGNRAGNFLPLRVTKRGPPATVTRFTERR